MASSVLGELKLTEHNNNNEKKTPRNKANEIKS